ncbi:Cytochrome c, mono-and diheme variants [Verrucomicrobium sp. GAS474]|uniref:c-type cytochrome n=1 Tax=Verrucomicrobium sp. GAS474 TaxID=1882831 RepID=UPI00087C39B4|nr:cytochrome c [Verrucomicrobium sp. GAS474]SDT96465.1 Cytochrome c, mono-and diheme variants [Verrucomicrobium sp. GAS474]
MSDLSPPVPPSAPRWLTLLAGIAGLWALSYLFLYNGGFDGATVDENATFAAAGDAGGEADPVAMGKKLYRRNCLACHGAEGRGLPGQYPPLAGSEIVLSKEGFGENHLAWIVLDGLVGPVRVAGAPQCNGAMVPWKGYFDDAKLAAVLTYIRQEWGNAAPPIAPEGVAAARAASDAGARRGPWTIPALLQHPAEALPQGPLPVAPKKESGTPP